MTILAGQVKLLPSRRGTGPRYGSLLAILVVTYLLSAFTESWLVSAVQVVLFLGVVLIALRTGRFRRRTGQLIAVGLLLGSVVATVLQLADQTKPGAPVESHPGAALASLWTAMLLLLAVFFIVRQVLAQPDITEQSIFGVLSAYMIIGLIFSAVFVAMWKFSPQPAFFANGASENTKTFQYFSFTTLTTLGYGDFTAAGDGGRAVAVIEAMVGQMFLATLVARLVAGFRWSDRAAARHASHPAAPAAQDSPEPSGTGLSGTRPGPGPAESRPGPGSGLAGPGPSLGPEPARAGVSSPGPSRAKKASAAGLIRLSPPGAVRGRGTGLRRDGRNGAGGSGPAPAVRPGERT
jgi:hypothetical protein